MEADNEMKSLTVNEEVEQLKTKQRRPQKDAEVFETEADELADTAEGKCCHTCQSQTVCVRLQSRSGL
jgi:hypothetical protein